MSDIMNIGRIYQNFSIELDTINLLKPKDERTQSALQDMVHLRSFVDIFSRNPKIWKIEKLPNFSKDVLEIIKRVKISNNAEKAFIARCKEECFNV